MSKIFLTLYFFKVISVEIRNYKIFRHTTEAKMNFLKFLVIITSDLLLKANTAKGFFLLTIRFLIYYNRFLKKFTQKPIHIDLVQLRVVYLIS